MAASAYDVAALALRGSEAVLNFPEHVLGYPVPPSSSPADIRKAAAAAAAMRQAKERKASDVVVLDQKVEKEGSDQEEFIDLEAFFNMPNLLVDMAGAMMVSPPRMSSSHNDDDPPEDESGGGSSLWSYH